MSTAASNELRFHALEKTNDPDVRARQRMILEWTLEAFPEEREKLIEKGIEEGELRYARTAVRAVLAARGLPLLPEEEARLDACTSLDTLDRWHKQAIVATSTAEALR